MDSYCHPQVLTRKKRSSNTVLATKTSVSMPSGHENYSITLALFKLVAGVNYGSRIQVGKSISR